MQLLLKLLFIAASFGIPISIVCVIARKRHIQKRDLERRCRCKIKGSGGIEVMCGLPTRRFYQMLPDDTVKPPVPGMPGKGYHPHLIDLCDGGHARIAHEERKWFRPKQLERRRRRDPGQFEIDRLLIEKAKILDGAAAAPLLEQMSKEQDRMNRQTERFVHSQATSITTTTPMPQPCKSVAAFQTKFRPAPRLRRDNSLGIDFRPNMAKAKS